MDHDQADKGQAARLLKRIKMLERQIHQPSGESIFKKKYEELLLQQGTPQATVLPVEPGPEASTIKGTWHEEGKDPVKITDDSHRQLQGMKLRLCLFPPNGPASKWWQDSDLGVSTVIQKPIRSSSLYMLDSCGHKTLNEAVVRQLHNR